jgi:hypothetical protein
MEWMQNYIDIPRTVPAKARLTMSAPSIWPEKYRQAGKIFTFLSPIFPRLLARMTEMQGVAGI